MKIENAKISCIHYDFEDRHVSFYLKGYEKLFYADGEAGKMIYRCLKDGDIVSYELTDMGSYCLKSQNFFLVVDINSGTILSSKLPPMSPELRADIIEDLLAEGYDLYQVKQALENINLNPEEK